MFLLAGCITTPTVETRRQNANDMAARSGWHAITLPVRPYQLQAFVPRKIPAANTLSIYIEGDGLAWRTRRSISSNPTPVAPVALQLALLDKSAAAYLARPCQYVRNQANCDSGLWTSARFSAEVITASNAAIDLLKQRFAASRIRLIGYSGGGAVAALVAARRNDISQLVTVAGNLDHVAWTRHHRVTPLRDSLNPADEWRALQSIPQVHFVGADDRTVNRSISESYRQRFPLGRQPLIKLVKGADHHCCWAEKWPKLLRTLQSTP